MKLRLFPRQEDAYFGLFQAAADTSAAATTVLLDLLIDLSDPETKAKQLAELEHEGDQVHRRVLAQLYDFTEEHPAQNVLRWKDVTDGIEHALDELPTSPTPWKGSSSNTPNRSWRCGRPAPAFCGAIRRSCRSRLARRTGSRTRGW